MVGAVPVSAVIPPFYQPPVEFIESREMFLETTRSAAVRLRQTVTVTDLVFLLSFSVGLCLVVFRQTIFPAKFFYDGIQIQGLAQGTVAVDGDLNFGRVAQVYAALGLQSEADLAALGGYLFFSACTVVVYAHVRQSLSQIRTARLIIATSMLLGAAYLGDYSKDVFVLPLVLIITTVPAPRRFDIAVFVAMLLYATVFRQYWYLIACLYLAARVFGLHKARARTTLILAITTIVATSFAASLALGQPVNAFRTEYNESRVGSQDAASSIPGYFPGNDWLSVAGDVFTTFIFLQAPIPLLLLGGVYYLFLAALIFWLWQLIALWQPGKRAGFGVRQQRVFALFASLLVVQSLFEPDYGSALRHLTPLMPLLLLLLGEPSVRLGYPSLDRRHIEQLDGDHGDFGTHDTERNPPISPLPAKY